MYTYPRVRDLREDWDLTQKGVANMIFVSISATRKRRAGVAAVGGHKIG